MSTGSAITPVADENDFNKHIAELPPSCLVVLYFHASWAEPCKQMSSVLTALATTYKPSTPPQIAFLSLDAEDVAEVSEQYDVTQVPLVVLQKGGRLLEKYAGTDATKVRNMIERHATGSTTTASSLPPQQKVTKQEPTQGVAPPTNGHAAPQSEDSVTNGAMTKEQLDQRLSELVKAAPVMLFMKGTPSAPQCGFSRQTVSMLREKNVRYGFFNILADDEVRQGLKEFSDWPTFPQVYVDGELVGGLDIVSTPYAFFRRNLLTLCIAEGGVRERSRLSQGLRREPPEQASGGHVAAVA